MRCFPFFPPLPCGWYLTISFVDAIIFLTADILSLLIQAAGGGIASSANTLSGSNVGGNVMLVRSSSLSLLFLFPMQITYRMHT